MNDHDVVPVANEYAPPSTLTSTLFTPEPLSDDVPEITTVAVLSFAPVSGLVIDTIGANVSIVIVTVIDVSAELPALSVALAVMV